MHRTGNFILEFPSINSRSRLFSWWRMRASPRGLWSRRQVWLPRMRQRDACWAGEVSLKGSHFATMRDSSPVSRYLYIDLWCKLTFSKISHENAISRIINNQCSLFAMQVFGGAVSTPICRNLGLCGSELVPQGSSWAM